MDEVDQMPGSLSAKRCMGQLTPTSHFRKVEESASVRSRLRPRVLGRIAPHSDEKAEPEVERH